MLNLNGNLTDENLGRVLRFIAEYEQKPGDPQRGQYSVAGDVMANALKLAPIEVNTAIGHLETSGAVNVLRLLNTEPFAFGGVTITTEGRLLYEKMEKGGASPVAQTNGSSVAGELDEPRAALEKEGWFLTNEKVGEGGGGVTYLAMRFDALESVRAYIEDFRTEDGKRQYANATALVITMKKFLKAEGDLIGVFKMTKHVSDRMKREIAVLNDHQHPNLMRIFAADREPSPRWYVMEYFENGSLTERWLSSRYTGKAREVLTQVRDVADALRVVHAAKRVHRDIKPDNIFIGIDGSWVVGDFGIVFEAGAPRHTEQGPTPMSKEWRPDWVVSRTLEEFPPSVDVFSLAKVAYALIAGPGKNPPASQLKDPAFDLRVLHPSMANVEVLQRFFEEHITTKEERMASKSAEAFIKNLDVLIDRLEWRTTESQVFSFVSPSPATDVSAAELRALKDVELLLPKGVRKLGVAIRYTRPEAVGAPLIECEVRNVVQVGRFVQHTGVGVVGWPGEWVRAEMVFEGGLGAGPHRFSVTNLAAGMTISALMISAEAVS